MWCILFSRGLVKTMSAAADTGSPNSTGSGPAKAPAQKDICCDDLEDSFELVEYVAPNETADQPAPVPASFDIRLFPEGISLAPSSAGIAVGTAAASITYTLMNQALNTSSDVAGATINGAGYLIERGAAYFGGEIAAMGVYYTRHTLAHGTRSSIRLYTPMTSFITSAVVGTTAAYTVTAGGVLARAAANMFMRTYRKYKERRLSEQYAIVEANNDGEKSTN